MKRLRNSFIVLLLLLPQAAQLQLQEVDWAAEAARLEMYRQHWNTHNIHRYEFLLDVNCFCFQDSPVRVMVEDDRVVAVLDPLTGEAIRTHTLDGNEGEVPVELDWYPTVAEMFAEIERAIANHDGTTHPGMKAGGFSVEYDGHYGYPLAFSVNYSRGMDDDGSELRASDSNWAYRLSELKSEPLPFRGAWMRTADAPLSARNYATIAWAADEIFVFGGLLHFCPSSAACLPPETPPLADGAAYDPATDTWRRIADAPAGIIYSQTVTIASDIFVLAVTSLRGREIRLLRYQADRDNWDEVELPENMLEPGIAAFGTDLILLSRNDQHGRASDWQLDTTSGEWTRLPDAPLGPGFSRQYVGFGDDLYLFDHELTEQPGSRSPSLLRAARLRAQQWELLPVAESIGIAPDLVAGNLLIAPALGCAGGPTQWGRCVPYGAVFDTATDTWRELPNAPRRGYKHVQSSGGVSASDLSLGTFATPGHPALDAVTGEWFTVPALDADRNWQRSIAAVGPYGFAFGGANSVGELLKDAWIWKP